MSGPVERDLRATVKQAFSQPREAPNLAANVIRLHRRRRSRRIVSGAAAAVAVIAVAIAGVAGGRLNHHPHTEAHIATAPTGPRLPHRGVRAGLGYQGSAGEDLDSTLLPKADAQWLATAAGKGAPARTAKLATLFAVPPGSPDAAAVALLQFDAADTSHWVGFAVEAAGTVTLQGLRAVPAAGVGQVATLLHLPSGDRFVIVSGPTVDGATVNLAGHQVTLTREGGGVFSAPTHTLPELVTLKDAAGTTLYAEAPETGGPGS